MNEKERLLAAIADLHSYLVHHPDQERCPVCPRWDELQGAAMQAVTAIDAHEAELAALRAELESAHAAQRHAETELSQYMAWYAMAEHQHLHEQRRAEKAATERDALRAAAMLSYGYLWSVQIEPGTPGLPPLKAVPAARIALRDALDNDERKAGIEQVRAALGER